MKLLLIFLSVFAASAMAGAIECHVCEWVVQEIDKVLQNRTITHDAVLHACNVVPTSAKSMCVALLNKVADELVDLFVAKVPPEKMCTILKMCTHMEPAANDNNDRIYREAQAWVGRSTASGPGGGTEACAWTVNKILSAAIGRTIGSNPNYVPSVEAALRAGAGTSIPHSNARAGDIVVAGNTGHIGIYFGGGRVQSNSSSRRCYCWNSNTDFDGTLGGTSRIYRVK